MRALDRGMRRATVAMANAMGRQATIELLAPGGYDTTLGEGSSQLLARVTTRGVLSDVRETGQGVKRGQKRFLVPQIPFDWPRAPEAGDCVVFAVSGTDDERWTVVSVEKTSSGDLYAAHTLVLSR